MAPTKVTKLLGRSGLEVPPLGFGAFKIGRNQGVKYPTSYDIPDDRTVEKLLNSILDLGCNLIDTAPAYGFSEERIGRSIGHRRGEFILSTKVGETFENGQSTYDYSASGVRNSIERSLKNLKTDNLDIVLIHSNGHDRQILEETETVSILQDLQSKGFIRAIGLSGKTIEGAQLAMAWADLLMVEFHLLDTSHSSVIEDAATNRVGIFVKKGLSSGKLAADESIQFVLSNPGVTSLIVGGLNFEHFQRNWETALRVRSSPT
jgi:aryl-alcohol dehydrogenase-like predicted oxidoreductase